MHPLLHTEFAALLVRVGVSQAGFARLTGLTARQVPRPRRHSALGGRARRHPRAEAIAMRIEETAFTWHETLGISPIAVADTIRLAMRRLALRYHPVEEPSADRGQAPSPLPVPCRHRAARTAAPLKR